MSANRVVTAPNLGEPVGYAHAVVAGPGQTIYLGGQAALRPDGSIAGVPLVEQFDIAAGNLVAALHAAGGAPEHLVSMQIFVTDVDGYRAATRELGGTWRRHFGRHYPALGLFGVDRLYEPEALVELMGVAVIPS